MTREICDFVTWHTMILHKIRETRSHTHAAADMWCIAISAGAHDDGWADDTDSVMEAES